MYYSNNQSIHIPYNFSSNFACQDPHYDQWREWEKELKKINENWKRFEGNPTFPNASINGIGGNESSIGFK